MEKPLHSRRSIRLCPELSEKIERIINKYPHKWANISHFVRSATNKFISDVENGEVRR